MNEIRLTRAAEARICRLANKQGYLVAKSRCQIGGDNFGEYMLVEGQGNYCVLGSRYDASLSDIKDWLAEGHS